MGSYPVWSIVLFDLPTRTKIERRAYRLFRNTILDLGYLHIQHSIYAHYTNYNYPPKKVVQTLREYLPPRGEVRVLTVSNEQWANQVKIVNEEVENGENPPEQLTIF